MQKWVRITTALLALTCTTPALAAGEHYFGAGIGAFSLSNDVNKDTVFGGYIVGGHHFNEYFSAEIRLGSTASSGDSDGVVVRPKQRMDFVAHYIKPQIALTEEITAYALAGFAVVHSTYQSAGGVKQSKNRISYAFGAGFNYQATDDYSVDVEYTHMLGSPGNTVATIKTAYKGLEADSFTAAIKYHF